MARIISEVEKIHVHLDSLERMNEKAFKKAIREAMFRFRIDEDGHSKKVEDWERSRCDVRVVLKETKASCGMCGWNFTIIFEAWCEKEGDDDD